VCKVKLQPGLQTGLHCLLQRLKQYKHRSRYWAWLMWLDAGFHLSGPGQFMWDLWWTKQHWGRFSLSTSVSLATCSTDCYRLIMIMSSRAGTAGRIVADILWYKYMFVQALWAAGVYWAFFESKTESLV
jgi:hypothetical protein